MENSCEKEWVPPPRHLIPLPAVRSWSSIFITRNLARLLPVQLNPAHFSFV